MSWREDEDYERVGLRSIRVEIRIGAYAAERAQPQPVEIDVDLFRRHPGYEGGGLDACLDYDRVFNYVRTAWPAREHTDLLEAWAEDLLTFCFADRRVEQVRLRLRKVAIYSGMAVPELEVVRNRPHPAAETAPDK